VIAWLLLQIGDVVLDPFDFGDAAMRVLLVLVAVGFPVALVLAWFFELTPTGIAVDTEAPGAPRPAVTGIRRYADIVIIGALVVAVAFLLARQGGLIEEGPGEHVVAVLPFENMSPEAEDAYFGEGLADTLIHKLGQLGDLVVLASQSTFQFKGRDLDLGSVGAKLGATVIMLGSVQRAGEALRINARLVEVGSGKQLWSGSYDRGVQDVFAIQDEIASSVTEALHLVLAPAAQDRLTTNATTNLTAYDAYVLGISRLARRTPEDRQRAMGYFRQAIAADPNYALPYTGLVEALYLNSHSGIRTEPVSEQYREAVEASGRAIEIDPELGEAWLARALTATIGRDFIDIRELSDDDIIALYEKAIELSPSNSMAH
jgi:TolB-like protein